MKSTNKFIYLAAAATQVTIDIRAFGGIPVASASDAFQALNEHGLQLILLDASLPDLPVVIGELRDAQPEVSLVLAGRQQDVRAALADSENKANGFDDLCELDAPDDVVRFRLECLVRACRNKALLDAHDLFQSQPLANTPDMDAELYRTIILLLVKVSESRSDQFLLHPHRVGEIYRMLAESMTLTESGGYLDGEFVRMGSLAASLHDIGYSASALDLTRAGELTGQERSELERHPVVGEQIMLEVADATRHEALASFFHMAARICRSHHEWFDGKGYPDGLAGQDIPLEARICAVADSYDAMRTARPHRAGFSHEQTLQMIENGAGTQFDPKIVKALALEQFALERMYA